MSYNEVFDTEILPDDPVTSLIAFRLRDNPIAAFNGEDGAPRLDPRARKPVAGWVRAASNTAAVLLGLDGLVFVPFLVKIDARGGGGNQSLALSYTTNGGVSWSSSTVITNGDTILGNLSTSMMMVYDRASGIIEGVGSPATSKFLAGENALPINAGSNVNGIRVAMTQPSNLASSITILDFGGTPS